MGKTWKNQHTTQKSTGTLSDLEKNFEKELALCLFFFFCFYVGAEITFAKFVYSYGICHFSMTRDVASHLTMTFWLSFTVFRFLAAFQAQFLSARTMIGLNLTGC